MAANQNAGGAVTPPPKKILRVLLLVSLLFIAAGVAWAKRQELSAAWDNWSTSSDTPRIGGTTENSRSSFEVDHGSAIPKSNSPAIRFNGRQQVVVDLKTSEWSPQIIVPPAAGSYCRIDVEPPTGFTIEFADGFKETVNANQVSARDWGSRRGAFWLLGTSPGQKATVTLILRVNGR